MNDDRPTTEAFRVELSNLRDDLAVIESSAIFLKSSTRSNDAVASIKLRIAELESLLERNDS